MSVLDAGESFIVTRNGTPVGELRPIRRSAFVPAQFALATFAGAPHLDLDGLRGDLDTAVDQDSEPQA